MKAAWRGVHRARKKKNAASIKNIKKKGGGDIASVILSVMSLERAKQRHIASTRAASRRGSASALAKKKGSAYQA